MGQYAGVGCEPVHLQGPRRGLLIYSRGERSVRCMYDQIKAPSSERVSLDFSSSCPIERSKNQNEQVVDFSPSHLIALYPSQYGHIDHNPTPFLAQASLTPASCFVLDPKVLSFLYSLSPNQWRDTQYSV